MMFCIVNMVFCIVKNIASVKNTQADNTNLKNT
jgi:hypothetical protein